ncbi:N-acetylneuraminate synthase family protein [Aeromonas allosaccharophila]|uniref:N-acetylneuraminate synthase family protein n=1 Tax=Aeromonas allosaccharophila TaxID=656 RepID=A0A7T2PI95_9GAMM|nr:N-acetylneuraminate synthase family protein [Aeromonas allosaccharophila]QPR56308.1 N-acetylneuraminate synthase family protein [Aeromonas allosaccharophila]
MNIDMDHIFSEQVTHNKPPFIILEAGINHNGDIAIAKDMICMAKSLGANAIKFQTFKAEEFVGDPELQFTYQSQGESVTESMLDMFKRYEFTYDEWWMLKEYCDEQRIIFLSTPQNPSDMKLLLELGVPALKVGSDDFTNIPLLKEYSSQGLPLLISCGMADMAEVYQALDITGAFIGKKVVLMLCTSQYPTPSIDVNLNKLKTLSAAFPNITLGFSDHTQGPLAAAIAYGLGAVVFEKHFTLDHQLPGPDHWFSEDPVGAKEWITAIHTAYQMMGSPHIKPTDAEQHMRTLARRSITVISDISPGEHLTAINIGLKRPGNGLPPLYFEDIVNKKAIHALKKGHLITWSDLQ